MNCTENETNSELESNREEHACEKNRKNGDKLRKKVAKNRILYNCKNCSYRTSNKFDYDKHCKTRKHLKKVKGERFKYICSVCEKTYTYKSSFLNHMQSHESVHKDIVPNDAKEDNVTKLLVQMLDENKKLQDKLIDIAKEPKVIHNNNQKTFNIIQFLNNDCKHAMNLSEFINTLEVTFTDLEMIQERGYLVGMKHSLIKSLGTMDETKRPIHCTDPKRRQFYIKNENVWNKDSNNHLIQDAVETYNNKQLGALSKLKQANPDWTENDDEQKKVNTLTRELTSMYSDSGDKLKNKLFTQMGEVCLVNKQGNLIN